MYINVRKSQENERTQRLRKSNELNEGQDIVIRNCDSNELREWNDIRSTAIGIALRSFAQTDLMNVAAAWSDGHELSAKNTFDSGDVGEHGAQFL